MGGHLIVAPRHDQQQLLTAFPPSGLEDRQQGWPKRHLLSHILQQPQSLGKDGWALRYSCKLLWLSHVAWQS